MASKAQLQLGVASLIFGRINEAIAIIFRIGLTWDREPEMGVHKTVTMSVNTAVFFTTSAAACGGVKINTRMRHCGNTYPKVRRWRYILKIN